MVKMIDSQKNQFQATSTYYMEEDIYCLVRYESAPNNTEMKWVMTYSSNNSQFPSKEFFNSKALISGTGYKYIAFNNENDKLFARGNYKLNLTINDLSYELPFQVISYSSPKVKIEPLITDVKDSEERIVRNYNWQYNNIPFEDTLYLPKAMYEYFKNLNKEIPKNLKPIYYSIYVTNPGDDVGINSVASYLNDIAIQYGFDAVEKANLVTSFVHCLRYTSDNETTPFNEYPKFPIETLVDEGGDCEDTSILLASLLKTLGYHVILVIIPDIKHCLVGIEGGGGGGVYTQHNGINYFIVETTGGINESTGSGWRVGEFPPEFLGLHTDVSELIPEPIIKPPIIHFQQANDIIKLTSPLENFGTVSADNVFVSTGFENTENELKYQQETGTFTINYDYVATVTFYLEVFDTSKENIHNTIVKTFINGDEIVYHLRDYLQ